MKKLFIGLAVVLLAAGALVWFRLPPRPDPLSEQEVIGFWEIASISGSEPSRLDAEMYAISEHSVVLREDHSLLYKFIFADSTRIVSGTWRLSKDRYKVLMSFDSGYAEVLAKNPRTGRICHLVGTAYFPCTRRGDEEPPRLTGESISMPRSGIIGRWKGKFISFGHASTSDPAILEHNKSLDEQFGRLRYIFDFKKDGMFICEQEDYSGQFPSKGTWTYLPKQGLIALNSKDMGTATQDLIIANGGKTLSFRFKGTEVRFTKETK